MSCSIRFAEREDVPQILDFIVKLAQYEKMEDLVVADEATLEEWLFDRKKAEVLIAEEAGAGAGATGVGATGVGATGEADVAGSRGKPVGFALFFHNFSTFLGRAGIYLEDLFVLPEYRGKGYGKALLTRLAGIAVERGCGRFEWQCLDWNTPSIEFYRSLGAVPLEGWIQFRVTGQGLRDLAEMDGENNRRADLP